MRYMLASILVATSVYVDMYQDGSNPNKTVIVIEKDGLISTYSVDNKDLNDELVEVLAEKYETK